jgi:hypothetical protein
MLRQHEPNVLAHSASCGSFPAGIIQILLEIANLLARSFQQVQLKSAEGKRRRSEAMRM